MLQVTPQPHRTPPLTSEPIMSKERLAIVRKNLEAAIDLRQTSATRVARAAGLSQNVLTRFLRGGSINYDNLWLACDVLDVPISLMSQPDALTPERIRMQKILDLLDPSDVTRCLEGQIRARRQ